MTINAIIALGAGAVIVAMLAIAFGIPTDPGSAKAPVRHKSGRRATTRRGVRPALQACQSAMRGAQDQLRRFLILLEADARNVRRFRSEHPDTDVLLLTSVVAIVLGALIGLH